MVFGFAFEVGEDVFEFVFGQAVQMGDDGIEFGEVSQAFSFVPWPWGYLSAQFFDEGFQVVGVVGEVDEELSDGLFDGFVSLEAGCLFEFFGWEDWELVENILI
ncbi:MAG: hypothetical protein PWQ84_1810 [Thermotogaceae bacterium]|nr:hypothetical protein [Thermotogaceae bacterium]